MERIFSLRHIHGGRSDRFPLGNRLFFIGASEENDVIIEETDIDSCAVKIEPVQSDYYCESIGRSVAMLNGKKLKRRSPLSAGDTIEIGSHKFIFECQAGRIGENTKTSEIALLQNIHRLIESIGRERSLPVLLDNLMSILTEVTGGTEVFIFKLDTEKKPSLFVTTCKGSSQEWFSDTIIQTVLNRGEGVCILNALSDPQYKNIHSIADLKLRSVICSPMVIAGKTIGLIYVGCRNASISFNQRDLDFLNLYATIAAMLINHVEYITQQRNSLSKLTHCGIDNGIVANSKVMQDLLSTIEAVTDSDITVLLQGETGTGKSRFAHLVHQKSRRSQKPFVVVNCSALHGELLESELFGHKKGSFTGAVSDHEGLFRAADGGTLFLDEIGELESALQAKLLRTLETNTIRPIGSTQEITVNTRVICATNRSLTMMLSEHLFRTDLYYRINQFSIEIPPLRKRGEDTVLLAYYFLEKYKAQYPNKDIFDFHPDTLRFISTHEWPGNIRELSNTIHRAVLTSRSPLIQFDEPIIAPSRVDFEQATRAFQKDLLQRTLNRTGGNKEDAARQLGLARSTFYRYLAQCGL